MTDTDFSWLWSDDELETNNRPNARSIIRANKRRMLRTEHKDNLSDLIYLPAKGESLHIISNGMFDFFTIPVILIDLLGAYTEHFYANTWTVNQQTILDLFDYLDNGKIGTLTILSDRSYKRRKPALYAQLIEGLRKRNMRYIASHNHAKVSLLNNGDNYIVIEGSASFTTTPRLEQHIVSNDYELWRFYCDFMEGMFRNDKKEK